jgi:hypothetical protein
MTITHKGMSLIVCEGQDNTVEFRIGDHRQAPYRAKTFSPACKEAVAWMLANAGEMKGNYER